MAKLGARTVVALGDGMRPPSVARARATFARREGDATARDYHFFLLETCVDTREFRYYVGDRLIAVSILDLGFRGVSSVYHYFDPDEAARALLSADAGTPGRVFGFRGNRVTAVDLMEAVRNTREVPALIEASQDSGVPPSKGSRPNSASKAITAVSVLPVWHRPAISQQPPGQLKALHPPASTSESSVGATMTPRPGMA